MFVFLFMIVIFVTETNELWGNSLTNTKEIKNIYLKSNFNNEDELQVQIMDELIPLETEI